MDDDLVEFLRQLRDEQHLNRSMLELFSDYGHLFSSNRETLQGKFEERLLFRLYWYENNVQVGKISRMIINKYAQNDKFCPLRKKANANLNIKHKFD